MKNGIYNEIINLGIDKKIKIQENKQYKTEDLKEESEKVLSKYIEFILKKTLEQVTVTKKENKNYEKIDKQIEICNKIIEELIHTQVDLELKEFLIEKKPKLLLSVMDKVESNIKKTNSLCRPITSISENTLFTGAANEYSLASELKKEILSADSIDLLVSFIRVSGLNLIYDELKLFTAKNNKLRIITTCYMGATELKAIKKLSMLPNTEIKISYDTKRTRLHAKSYCFSRHNGYTTAYIGSSNMSKVAMSSGLEWNVKISEKESKGIIDKFKATFEAYWNEDEFELYCENDEKKLEYALKREKNSNNIELESENNNQYFFDIKPYSYQKNVLDEIEAERINKGNYKNLIVSATGTGKTVIAAFDYKRFIKENKNSKILFIAHRIEILKQARNCFRNILRDSNFGTIISSDCHSENIDQLFITIQSVNSRELYKLDQNYYDYIVIDEVHHSAAKSYDKIISHFNPKVLLGLTATPERMDGGDILKYFNDRITAEIRLSEAINRKLLCPFQYYCINDSIDLSDVKWNSGGYDKSELSNVYTKNNQRVKEIIEAIDKYTSSISDIKGLGFCVSKEHASFMAKMFNNAGIDAISLDCDSSFEKRNKAKQKLSTGEVKFIFVVDLYNEGVDIKEVNTILFLRPTESLTIFLQQLGRGLRLSENKGLLTVFDFIGQQRKEYKFFEKFNSIIGKTKHSLKENIENDFPNLPKGCFIYLEKQAQETILNNIKNTIFNKNKIKQAIKLFSSQSDEQLNVKTFIKRNNLNLEDIYKASNKSSFYKLCIEAGVIKDDLYENNEQILKDDEQLSKGIGRLIKTCSLSWFKFLLKELNKNSFELEQTIYKQSEKRMICMLFYTLYSKGNPKSVGINCEKDIIEKIQNNKNISKELGFVLEILIDKIDYVEKSFSLNQQVPLKVNSIYSREQILASFGVSNINVRKPSREGVLFIREENIDLFFVTLNKSEKNFSPNVMYDDYAISRELFHWQSQNSTSSNSNTGKRYMKSDGTKNKVFLFVREENKLNGNTAPYYFLGEITYVSSKGNKPMSIIWKLKQPMIEKIKIKTSSGIIAK